MDAFPDSTGGILRSVYGTWYHVRHAMNVTHGHLHH